MRVAGLAVAMLAGTLALAAENQSSMSSGSSSESGSASGSAASSGTWQSRPTNVGGSSASKQGNFTQDQYGLYDRRYNWKTTDNSFDSWAKDVTSSGTGGSGGTSGRSGSGTGSSNGGSDL